MKHGDFPMQNRDFPIKNCNSPIDNGDVPSFYECFTVEDHPDMESANHDQSGLAIEVVRRAQSLSLPLPCALVRRMRM